MYHVAKIIYDKNENTQDKLTTVYSTIFSLQNYGLAMLLNGSKDHVDLYLGVITRNMVMRQTPLESDMADNNEVQKEDGKTKTILLLMAKKYVPCLGIIHTR